MRGISSETRRKFLKTKKALIVIDSRWLQGEANVPSPCAGTLGLEDTPLVLVTAPYPHHASFPVSALGLQFLAVTGRRHG